MSDEEGNRGTERPTVVWKGDGPGGPQVVFEGKKYRVGGFKPEASQRILLLANRLLEEATDDEEQAEASVLGAIFLQAAALECFVNDVLIGFVLDNYGASSRHIAESLMSGSLRSKIIRAVPIATHGRRQLDTDHSVVRTVFRLIKQRNRLTHVTNYFRESLDESSQADQKRSP